ncbi:hypothetical protein PBY51_010518 [Eleginops maclovinus]|uniref:Uncharacterized protein n=1 Tax=Eleginops maclovinus TaxID=56733 RepID=A0AAN8AJL0_ELEMC|nr:hypothetical protein PBY51_010518 [Eleginops maclovinus]
MAGPASVRYPLGTPASPQALSDRGAIYLSASTSTPSLPNPLLSPGAPGLPWRTLTATLKSITLMAVRGTWMALGQVSALNTLQSPTDRSKQH